MTGSGSPNGNRSVNDRLTGIGGGKDAHSSAGEVRMLRWAKPTPLCQQTGRGPGASDRFDLEPLLSCLYVGVGFKQRFHRHVRGDEGPVLEGRFVQERAQAR